tara:strand:+ start:322 stop:717 length:396 start_codon:yes stop_codon:yes gene_type:complete
MKKSLSRLGKLRASLKKQAEFEAGLAEKRYDESKKAVVNIHQQMVDQASFAGTSAGVFQLCDVAAQSAKKRVEHAEVERDQSRKKLKEKALEHKQVERLMRKIDERDRKSAARKEQKTMDEWATMRVKGMK